MKAFVLAAVSWAALASAAEAAPPAGFEQRVEQLRKDVEVLQESVEEYRRLNERLSDVLDIVEEILVPAVDRDEEKLRALLAKL